MKRWIPIFLLAVLLCSCTVSPPQINDSAVPLPQLDVYDVMPLPPVTGAISEPVSGSTEETVEPAYDPIPMPGFNHSDTDDTLYCDVTPKALQGYIDLLCSQGFTCVGDEWLKFLYRSDAILSLVDNTHSEGTASLYIDTAKQTSGGVTAEDVKPLLAKSHYFGSEFIMEQTPDGLYEAIGAQRFLVLNLIDGFGQQNSPTYVIQAFVVGSQGAQLLYGSDFLCADVDADGRTELVALGPGPTSGLFTVTLTAYEIMEGYPVVDGKTVLLPRGWGRCALTEQNADICLRFAPNESREETVYQIKLCKGEFQIEGMQQCDGSDYANLPTDKGLDLYVWQTDGEFFCGLMPSSNRKIFEGELNALPPITLERMKMILSDYSAHPYLSFISRPSGSPVTFSDEQKKEINERLFG